MSEPTKIPLVPDLNDPQAMIELLRPFCDRRDNGKLFLKQPFRLDGWLFASDASCLVAYPAPAGVDDALLPIAVPDSILSTMGRLLKQIRLLDIPERPFPKLNIPKAPDMLPCKECDGKTTVEFSNEFNSYTCECQTCEGSGGETPLHVTPIEDGSMHYHVWTLLKLSKLQITGWAESHQEQFKGFACTLQGGGYAFLIDRTPLPASREDA